MAQAIVHVALVVRDYDEAIAFFTDVLATDDFWRDYHRLRERAVVFVREPQQMSYGIVAVFRDLYGNLWDLVQYAPGHPAQVQARD